jgi:hypothetical protein
MKNETAVPTLRQIIEEAIGQIATYKHPDVDEAQGRLHELLKAAELGGIEHDGIVSIEECGDTFRIQTEWSARGCLNTSDYELPSFIIDADDPVAAARIWGIEKKVKEAERAVDEARSTLLLREKRLAEFKEKRASIERAMEKEKLR